MKRITLLLTVLALAGLAFGATSVAASDTILIEGETVDEDWQAVDDELYLVDADSDEQLDSTTPDDGVFDVDNGTALETTATDATLEIRVGSSTGDPVLFPNASVLADAGTAANSTDANVATVVIADDPDNIDSGTATFHSTDGEYHSWSFDDPPEEDDSTTTDDDSGSGMPQAAGDSDGTPEAYNESATTDDRPWYFDRLPAFIQELFWGDDGDDADEDD